MVGPRTCLALSMALACAALSAGCGGEAGPPPGTTPMQELIKSGQAPVEVASFGPAGNLVVPQF